MKTELETTTPDRAVKRSVSLPQSMAKTAEKRAAADGRSLSNYIQWLIQQDVDKAGSTPASAR